MHRRIPWTVCLPLSLLLSIALMGWGMWASAQKSDRVLIVGSPSMAPLVRAIAQAYGRENPDCPRFEIQEASTEIGMQALYDKAIDISMRGRDFDPPTVGSIYDSVALAIDPLAVIVNPQNRDITLSANKLGRILCGLDRSDYHVILPAKDTAEYMVLLNNLNVEQPINILYYDAIYASALSPQQTIDWVSGDPNAMGFVPFSQLPPDANVRVLRINDIGPWQLFPDLQAPEYAGLDYIKGNYPFLCAYQLMMRSDRGRFDDITGSCMQDFMRYVENREWERVIAPELFARLLPAPAEVEP